MTMWQVGGIRATPEGTWLECALCDEWSQSLPKGIPEKHKPDCLGLRIEARDRNWDVYRQEHELAVDAAWERNR